MPLNSIYTLFKQLENEQSMLSFKGVVTKELLATVLEIVEVKLRESEDSASKRKKVYNVLVECLQNLYHHNEKKFVDTDSLSLQSAIFLVSKDKDAYEVKTGNYVKKEEVSAIENKIKEINLLNKDELRAMYREVLKNGQLSQKGTAGLGLIDIARKSGNKLKYQFINVDKEYSFFCLNVIIN